MAIDPSIPLQVQTPAPYDAIGQTAKVLQLKQMQAAADAAPMQREMASLDLNTKQMQNKQLQQNFADEQALKKAYVMGPDGKLDRQATLANVVKINPAIAPKLTEEWTKQDAAQTKMMHDYVQSAGPISAGLLGKFQKLSAEKGEQAAWAELQPEVQSSAAQLKQMFPNMPGLDPSKVTPQTLAQSAGMWDKYQEHQMKQASPQSAEGKIKQDVKSGNLSAQEGERAINKKDYIRPIINVNAGGADAGRLSKTYAEDPEYSKRVDYWADVLAKGGTLPPRFAQSGAGKKMMPDILLRVPTISDGADSLLANQVQLGGEKAGARTAATRAANVQIAADEAINMMPILQKASDEFKRTGYQPINKVIASYQDGTGSVESRKFGAALNTFINVYARAVSPSGAATVSDKEHARELLSRADSHEQLMGVLGVMRQEMDAALKSPEHVQKAQRERMTGKKGESKPDEKPLRMDDNGNARPAAKAGDFFK